MKHLLKLTDSQLLELAPEATHQHKKGGLYRFMGLVRDADTGGLALHQSGDVLVVYEHLYPHEQGFWLRRSDEFNDGRFRRLKP